MDGLADGLMAFVTIAGAYVAWRWLSWIMRQLGPERDDILIRVGGGCVMAVFGVYAIVASFWPSAHAGLLLSAGLFFAGAVLLALFLKAWFTRPDSPPS